MLERVQARLTRIAERRTEARVRAALQDVRGALPGGVSAERTSDGMVLTGRGLKRRFALEPALRWIVAGLK